MDENLFAIAHLDYINSHTLIEIKGGISRETFLEIWMVSVGQRVFARSWGMKHKSWFTEFVENHVEQIKLGDDIFNVKGQQLLDPEMNRAVDQAYHRKYIQKENIPYVEEIIAPTYKDFTMDFFFNPANETRVKTDKH